MMIQKSKLCLVESIQSTGMVHPSAAWSVTLVLWYLQDAKPWPFSSARVC